MKRLVFLFCSVFILLASVPLIMADSWNVELVGITPGAVCAVYVVDNYAYLCSGAALVILDVTDPQHPIECSWINVPIFARGIYVMGDYAYMVGGISGGQSWLGIIDISNPGNPCELGYCYTSGIAQSVYVIGEYAYLAAYEDGIRVIDVSVPTDPVEVGFCDTPGHASGINVVGNYAYIADGELGLQIIDISNPVNPYKKGSNNNIGVAEDISIRGNYAYMAMGSSSGLSVIDISDVNNPIEIGRCHTHNWGRRVHVVGDYAYLAASVDGLRVIDVSVPTDPVEVGFCDTPRDACGIYVVGNYAYVACCEFGLRVVDVSSPFNPHQVGYCRTSVYAEDVQVLCNYAYVASGEFGLTIIDVSLPTTPYVVGVCDTPGWSCGVNVVGKYAYLADGIEGLRVIDISIPTKPKEVGACNTSGQSLDVCIQGNYAYVADDWAGLRIIDVSDPSKPYEVGFYDTIGDANGLCILDNYAYLAETYRPGLRVIDISDPTNPYLVGNYYSSGYAHDVQVIDKYAYIACGDAGLRVLDVSNRTNPHEVGSYDTGYACGIYIADHYAYVACGYDIRIIDISNPLIPQEVGFYDTSGWTSNVCVVEGYTYATSRYLGLCILRYIGQQGTVSSLINGYVPSNPNNPIEVEVGNSTDLSVTFTNTGNTAWQFIAGASVWDSVGNIVGNYEKTLDTALEPGNQTTVSWAHVVNQPGDYWLQFGVWKAKPYIEENLLNKKPNLPQKLIVGIAGLELSASNLTFGEVIIGQAKSQPITIKNNNSVNARITSINSDEPDFATDMEGERVIPPYGETTVNVTFAPQKVAEQIEGKPFINSEIGDINSQNLVTMSGSGEWGGSEATISYPCFGFPAIVKKGNTIKIETFGHPTEAIVGVYTKDSLNVTSPWIFRGSSGYFNTAGIEEGFYDLRIKLSDGSELVQSHALRLVEDFKESFKFLQLTDLHLDLYAVRLGLSPYTDPAETDTNSVTNFKTFIDDQVNRKNSGDFEFEFAVLTGDLVDFSIPTNWQMLYSVLLRFEIPVYVLPGNHDYREAYPINDNTLGSSASEWVDDNGLYNHFWKINSKGKGPFSPLMGSFEYGENLFIILDSGHDYIGDLESLLHYNPITMDPRGSGIEDNQMNFLKDELGPTKYNSQFIFMHHPAFSNPILPYFPEGNIIGQNRKEFISLCAESNTTMVLAGHTHENRIFDRDGRQWYPIAWPGPAYIQTGSWRIANGMDHFYRIINVHGAGDLNIIVDAYSMEWDGGSGMQKDMVSIKRTPLAVFPYILDLGEVSVIGFSVSKTVRIYNFTKDLMVGIESSSSAFKVDNKQFDIPGGSYRDVLVKFDPIWPGERKAILEVKDTNGDILTTIAPIGHAYAPLGTLIAQSLCPVDLVVTDPEGRTISKDSSTIPSASYVEMDLDGDGNSDDRIIIPGAPIGGYAISVIPEPDAKPTDVYTLGICYGDNSVRLAENVMVQDIPVEPYGFPFLSNWDLEPGWNLISIPLKLTDDNLDKVLQPISGHYDSVYTYDSENSQWKGYFIDGPSFLNRLGTIEPGKGYMIHITDSTTLTVDGDEIENEPILLKQGWNLVGYNCLVAQKVEDALLPIAGCYNSVWTYDATSGGWSKYIVGGLDSMNTLKKMKPGMGYWINAKTDCTWIVPSVSTATFEMNIPW